MRNVSLQEVLIATIWAIIPVFAMVTGVMIQRFRTQERLRAIEKGLPLPPELYSRPRLSPAEQTANFRVAGIICVAVGLGLLVLFAGLAESVPKFPKGVTGASAIPFFIGVGFLLEYRIRRSAAQ
jgi:hypothetical protein